MPSAPRSHTSRARLRIYLAVTLAFPWLALGLLEAGLRVARYGNDYPLFVTLSDHPDYLVANQQVARRYFANGPFVPTPQLDFFRSSKKQGTLRIFFQGESSALGFPYVHGGAPSRMLEQRLQSAFPNRDIEVVNTALTAVNSYTLVDFADEIIAQHPDAVMIYTGHNEYYGAFGAGSSNILSGRRALVKAYLLVRKSRVAQLMLHVTSGARQSVASPERGAAPRNVMELMAGDQRIPLGSERYRAGLEQFRANLGELLSRYRAAGIPVFIGTIASNERDQPPFITGLRANTDSAAWWQTFQKGAAALQAGDTAGAEKIMEQARATDSTGAVSAWFLGRIKDSRSDFQAAARYYRSAREHDELRFRAPEAINDIIRTQAALHGANVVETEQALQRASPAGIVGSTVMLEHLHPNIDGYFIIADAFFKSMSEHGLISGSQSPSTIGARQSVPVTAVDSLVGLYHTDRLTSGWPFRPKGSERIPVVDTLQPKSIVEQLARDVVLGAVSWPEAMERLRASYEQAGKPDEAVRVALAMAQEYRYSAQPYVDAARIEVRRKRYDEALMYTLAATAREEKANTVQLAGLLLLRQGDHARAMRYLERAAELAPNEQRMIIALRSAKAIPELEAGRLQSPRDTTLLYSLAGAYALTQQYEKSRETLAALEAIAPNHAGAKQLRKRLPPD